jgi:hypothetical protein
MNPWYLDPDNLTLNSVARRLFKEDFHNLEPYQQNEIMENYEYKLNILKEKEKMSKEKVDYRLLAEQGRFNELPDTCEFSEPIELDVSVSENRTIIRKKVYGKFKGNYITDIYLSPLEFARTPKEEIDFTEYKKGDVVEIETDDGLFYGVFCGFDEDSLILKMNKKSEIESEIPIEEINKINKIK